MWFHFVKERSVLSNPAAAAAAAASARTWVVKTQQYLSAKINGADVKNPTVGSCLPKKLEPFFKH